MLDKEDKGWETKEQLALNVCEMLVFINMSEFCSDKTVFTVLNIRVHSYILCRDVNKLIQHSTPAIWADSTVWSFWRLLYQICLSIKYPGLFNVPSDSNTEGKLTQEPAAELSRQSFNRVPGLDEKRCRNHIGLESKLCFFVMRQHSGNEGGGGGGG